jgi:hypothetical protein
MKSVLLALLMTISSMAGMAQDFATRFMTEHQQDGHISCITISPTMMNKILKVDAVEKDENMSEMISNLKSMQLITSDVRPLHYYREALKIIDKNADRFEPYHSFKDHGGEGKIMLRKHKGVIVEMVLLKKTRYKFSVINFTGNMSEEFISQLAGTVKQRHD